MCSGALPGSGLPTVVGDRQAGNLAEVQIAQPSKTDRGEQQSRGEDYKANHVAAAPVSRILIRGRRHDQQGRRGLKRIKCQLAFHSIDERTPVSILRSPVDEPTKESGTVAE
jgi:hypothetical protein